MDAIAVVVVLFCLVAEAIQFQRMHNCRKLLQHIPAATHSRTEMLLMVTFYQGQMIYYAVLAVVPAWWLVFGHG